MLEVAEGLEVAEDSLVEEVDVTPLIIRLITDNPKMTLHSVKVRNY